MSSQFRRLLIEKPLAFIHFLGGAGAATLAFLLTFNGHSPGIALPILIVCLIPDTLYSVSRIMEFYKSRITSAELFNTLKVIWFMMACAAVLIYFAAWMGSKWAILNAAFGAN